METSLEQDLIVTPDAISFAPFTLPGWTGTTSAAFVNTDVSKAPFIALAKLAPGAYIERHLHPVAVESVYVVAGELINNGERLPTGTFMVHGPGVAHGPHTTETGCTLMFLQYPGVTVEDTVLL